MTPDIATAAYTSRRYHPTAQTQLGGHVVPSVGEVREPKAVLRCAAVRECFFSCAGSSTLQHRFFFPVLQGG